MPLVDHTTLSISVFDKLGRKFDNFSSVFVEWKLSDPSLGNLEPVLDSGTEDLGQRTEYRRKFFAAEAEHSFGYIVIWLLSTHTCTQF